jgi:serine/threonine-protein kinase
MPLPRDDDFTRDRMTSSPTLGVATAPTPPPASQRFAPGSIVAGRYRLVALLGRGGMGEVYRAEDLTLDQPVALKFLPDGVAVNDTRLAQFHNELRVARQVSHKNVCRLYDLGDADGRRFLTMEYVDGEDLASLLRRIGRIPEDKAIQMARQLCAAVSAAHERGVLHRDLKPANVMIDGDGNVRVTDFGIATATADAGAELAGTPQYMAPEVLAGRPASTKSDIYALGLILFEIFTGRRAYDAKTLGDLKQLHETGTVTTPSSIVRDLDPVIERVILRCLEKDPERRPASALTVAASLPGGDPVAAALAAGETPSPGMLAAAGESDALDVGWGVAAVAAVAVGLLVFAGLSAHTSIVGRVPLDKGPDVLIDRAERMMASLGYSGEPGGQAFGFMPAGDYTGWLWRTHPGPKRWDSISIGNPSALLFWYRTSPREMVPIVPPRVRPSDPPVIETDMRLLILDTRGRLREFRSVPPQVDATDAPREEPRWNELFEAAGLTMSAFWPTAPTWVPRDYADARAAWEGPLPEQPDLRVRIEAAGYRGKPVWFSIVGPWTRPTLMQARQGNIVDRVINGAVAAVSIMLVVTAMLLARRHLRANRADRRGAVRLVVFFMITGLLGWLVGGTHVPDVVVEANILSKSAQSIALDAVMMLAFYLALEPYVRRFWPDSLLGWSRIVAGHVLDPRVGRDVLAGVVLGTALSLIDLARPLLLARLGYSPPIPGYGTRVDVLGGPSWLISAWLGWSTNALEVSLVAVFLFVVLRLLLRRLWLSVIVGGFFLTLLSLNNAGTTNTMLVWVFVIASAALHTMILVRFGLLPFAVSVFVRLVMTGVPLSLDVSRWWAVPSNWTLALLMALTLFGFYASRAGQPLFGRVLSE